MQQQHGFATQLQQEQGGEGQLQDNHGQLQQGQAGGDILFCTLCEH